MPTDRHIVFGIVWWTVKLILVAAVDFSLLLERESFLILVLFVGVTLFFLLLRGTLALYADNRMRMPRFHLREHVLQSAAAFFSTPEIEQ